MKMLSLSVNRFHSFFLDYITEIFGLSNHLFILIIKLCNGNDSTNSIIWPNNLFI